MADFSDFSDFLVELERQGGAAGRAAAEHDYREGSRAERVASFEVLAQAAQVAASDHIRSIQRADELGGDALTQAKQTFTNAYMDAYILRLGELISPTPR